MRRPFLRGGFSIPRVWGYRVRRFASPRRPAERSARRSVRMADSTASICCRRATIPFKPRRTVLRCTRTAACIWMSRAPRLSNGDIVGKGAGAAAQRTPVPATGAAFAGGQFGRHRGAAEFAAAGRDRRPERGRTAHQRFGLPAGRRHEHRPGLQRAELRADSGRHRGIPGAGGAVQRRVRTRFRRPDQRADEIRQQQMARRAYSAQQRFGRAAVQSHHVVARCPGVPPQPVRRAAGRAH